MLQLLYLCFCKTPYLLELKDYTQCVGTFAEAIYTKYLLSTTLIN